MTHTIGVFASLFDDDGRMVLVRQSYAGRCWTQPGGRLEPGENPVDGVLREIYEEACLFAEVVDFIGTYVSLHKNDVVLHFRAKVSKEDEWRASDEILECARYAEHDLPSPMRPHTRERLRDGFSGATGLLRIISDPDRAGSPWRPSA